MLLASLSVCAVLHSREEFLRLRAKCKFTRAKGPGWSMLQRHGSYNIASHDDPVERQRTIRTTWCMQPDSEIGAYLGVFRLDMGQFYQRPDYRFQPAWTFACILTSRRLPSFRALSSPHQVGVWFLSWLCGSSLVVSCAPSQSPPVHTFRGATPQTCTQTST